MTESMVEQVAQSSARSISKPAPPISASAVLFELMKMSERHVKQASLLCGTALNL
jgi:hypothetical protein